MKRIAIFFLRWLEGVGEWAQSRADRLEYPKWARGEPTCITDFPPGKPVYGSLCEMLFGGGVEG